MEEVPVNLSTSEIPLFGGWTPTYEGDLCKGGHPLQADYKDVKGRLVCNRCGRQIDWRRCFCGQSGHAHMSRSFCPTRMRFDRRDAEIHKSMFEYGSSINRVSNIDFEE